MKAGDWLQAARASLATFQPGELAAREARLILQHATGWAAARVSTSPNEALSNTAHARAERLLTLRLNRRPLSQVLGEWPFYGRPFAVTQDVLTPRPDTETLVEICLSSPYRRVLDLGTGSGAIIVTLLAEQPEAGGLATDLSSKAIDVARANAHRHGVADRLDFAIADWWEGVTGKFDLIASNPPYVTETAYGGLAPEIIDFEPKQALTPGGDGLAAYRAIFGGLWPHLLPGGRLVLEIGHDQAAAVTQLCIATGLDMVRVHPDIDGRDRVVSAVMPNGNGI